MILNPANNKKLGPNVLSWSRPVGPTCPSSCPFLGAPLPNGSLVPHKHRCYAENIQRRRTTVAIGWAKNYMPSMGWKAWSYQLSKELTQAANRGLAVRIHIGGDWVDSTGALDRPYLAAVLGAYRRLGRAARPLTWFYTHAWRAFPASLLQNVKRLGIQAFASVHGALEASQARSRGWRLAVDPGEDHPPVWGAPYGTNGPPALHCPEQRCRGKVTCSNCRYCFRAERGDVVFARH